MTAKDKQTAFINSHLKPLLKQHGYKTSGQTWWKDKGEFFIVINLQNYSWNNRDRADFCFNICIALTATLNDSSKKKAGYHDHTALARENICFPVSRQVHTHRSNTGYSITDNTDADDFNREILFDFEQFILPKLERLVTLSDCLDFFGRDTFWGQNLLRQIEINNVATK
jgi:hypothetical protein